MSFEDLTAKGDFLATSANEAPSICKIEALLNNSELTINGVKPRKTNSVVSNEFDFILNIKKLIEKEKIRKVKIKTGLEAVRDPRQLLGLLKNVLDLEVVVEVWFSKKLGEYRRFWNLQDAKKLMHKCGFDVVETINSESFNIIKIDNKNYDKFLSRNSLPDRNIRHLIVTTEHSDYRITGGIGSYVKECEELYGKDVGIMIIDSNNDVQTDKINDYKWLSLQELIGNNRVREIDSSNYDMLDGMVFEALQQVLLFYPNLKSVESQELLLARSIEAKRTSLLPSELKLITVCHGASFHLARAKNEPLELEQLHVAYKEKRTIEKSDLTIFPTNYLRNSYMKVGVEPFKTKNTIKRLPFDLSSIPKGDGPKRYSRILYVGKTNTVKGFDIFLKLLIELAEKHPEIINQRIDVKAVVTYVDIIEPKIKKLYSLAKNLFNIEIVSLKRSDLLQLLAEHSEDTLAVITYPGDNHPTVILELMAIGHDFIAIDKGGTPELINRNFAHNYIFKNDTSLLADIVFKIFKEPDKRRDQILKLRENYLLEQAEINKSYKVSFFDNLTIDENTNSNSKKIEVFIESYNNKKFYKNTLSSLESQTYKNFKIVNSEKFYTSNKNVYKLRIKEGDLLSIDALELLSIRLNREKQGAVLANEMVTVYENSKFLRTAEFSPNPPELGSIYLQEKYKRRFIALFEGKHIDIEFKNLTDWEMAISILSKNSEISIVPLTLFKLVRNDSEIVWDRNENMERMLKVATSLTPFDMYVMNSQLIRLDDIYYGSLLLGRLNDIFIRKDDPSVIHGATPNLIKGIGAYRKYVPKPVHRVILFSLKAIHRIGRKVKSVV